MFGRKSNFARKLGHKSSNPARLGHKRRGVRGKSQQFLNTNYPNTVPVPQVNRLKNTDTTGKLGE